MADEDLEKARTLFPTALTFPPHRLEPENADRHFDERTARMVRRLREDHPDHVIVVLG